METLYTFAGAKLVKLDCAFSINKIKGISAYTWVWEDELGYFVKGILDYNSDSSYFEKKRVEGLKRPFYTKDNAISRINASALTLEQKELAINRVNALPNNCLFNFPTSEG
jgi:hypothetical protein